MMVFIVVSCLRLLVNGEISERRVFPDILAMVPIPPVEHIHILQGAKSVGLTGAEALNLPTLGIPYAPTAARNAYAVFPILSHRLIFYGFVLNSTTKIRIYS